VALRRDAPETARLTAINLIINGMNSEERAINQSINQSAVDQSINPLMRYPSIGLQKVGRATEVALPLGLTDFVLHPLCVWGEVRFFTTYPLTVFIPKP